MIQIILLDNGVRVANIDYPNNHLVFGIERTNIIEIFDSGKKVVSAPYTEFINELGQPFLTPESVITTLELSYLNLVSQEELDVEIADRVAADTALSNRTTILENNEYKITYYEIISGASGSLTLPTGATINTGEFGLSGNAILSKIDGSNKPTFESPKTSGGTIVTASLNETTGAWVASGTYTDTDVALIYSIKIKAVNYSNLDYDFIIETIEIDTGVQSVTGPQVDDTDPNNPIVNPLGLIQIIDLDGDFFTDLATATNWIEQFFSDPTIITDKSFNDNIFFFTVPNSTVMKLADGFLNNSTASFIDNFGLITEFQGGSVFYQNNAKHIFKDIFFNVVEAFTKAELNVECQDFNMDGGCAFASNTSGTFKIKGDIDPASASSGFFSASTATILASAKLYTSNSGVIDASLEQAILNGCNVQFEGINLATLNTAETLTNKRITQRVTTIASSATPTPNADTDDEYTITALATAALLTNPIGTPTEGQPLLVRIKDNGTARALTFDTLYRFSTDQPAPTTTKINKTLYLGFVYNFTDTKWDCLGWITNV